MTLTQIFKASETLANYTSPALMVPALQSRAPKEVIAELCSTLQRDGQLSDKASFYDAVMARELMSATSISPGWALPHARLKGLAQLSFVMARSSQPLVWFGENGLRVQTVLLFAVPEAEAKTYLSLIAAVAKLSQNDGLVEQLLRAPDSQSMFAVLRQVPLRQPRLPAIGSFKPRSLETR